MEKCCNPENLCHMSSSLSKFPSSEPEQGDNIINWHLQYIVSASLQGAVSVQNTVDLFIAEIAKIKTDSEYVKGLEGPHKNLLRLNASSKDLCNALDKLREISDLLRMISCRASRRII